MQATTLRALIVVVPETAGSALYGMFDVLGAAGNIWQSLVRTEPERRLIAPAIVGLTAEPFRCGNAVPVAPDYGLDDAPAADIVVVPEIWLAPDAAVHGLHPPLMGWLRQQHRRGAYLYSACSGSILLAEAGLLNRCPATSHWAYADLFRTQYPDVRFQPDPSLVFADATGRLVTAGGTTSWHDLAVHIVAKHCGPAEAMRIAKTYLLKWHQEGQSPYACLVRAQPHADAVVRVCEDWLAEHFKEPHCVSRVVARAAVPERTLKRRFRQATGHSLIDHVQALRIEEAKRLLESTRTPADEVAAVVGYEEPAFFRRLFKRLTGLTPGQYRRLFQPIHLAAAA